MYRTVGVATNWCYRGHARADPGRTRSRLAITALVDSHPLGHAAPPLPSPTSCEPLPAAAPDTAPVWIDVDGDGIVDPIIPTECDGRTNCTLAVFLTRKSCPLAFGSVKGGLRSFARTKRPFLPLTSHGIRLMWTHPRSRSRRTRFDHGASLLCPEPQLGKLETWRSAHSARE